MVKNTPVVSSHNEGWWCLHCCFTWRLQPVYAQLTF